MTTTKTTSKKRTVNNNQPAAKVASNAIRFKISTKVQNSNEIYEAVAEIPGFRPTKVTRTDGSTIFTTKSSLTKACKDRAATFKRTPVFDFGNLPAVTKTKITQRLSGKVPVAASGVCPVTGATAPRS